MCSGATTVARRQDPQNRRKLCPPQTLNHHKDQSAGAPRCARSCKDAAANAAGPASGTARIPGNVDAPSPATGVRCCSTAPRGAATSTKRPCSSSCLAANASCGTSRVGAEEAASLNAPTRGMPPARAKTKAAGFGPACCECPPAEVAGSATSRAWTTTGCRAACSPRGCRIVGPSARLA